MSSSRALLWLTLIVLVISPNHSMGASAYAVVNLYPLSPSQQPGALNDAGVVVGTHAGMISTCEAAMYKNGVVSGLNMPGLEQDLSWAVAINNNEQIVGDAPYHGSKGLNFVYRNGTLTDLAFLGEPVAINDLGVIAGRLYVAPVNHAFRLDSGNLVDLGETGYGPSGVQAINSAGVVVGAFTNPTDGNLHAFSVPGGKITDIGVTGSIQASAADINDSGTIVIVATYLNAPNSSYLYKDGVSTKMGCLPGYNGTSAAAINNNGDVVGCLYAPSGGLSEAFLQTNGSMQDLNDLVDLPDDRLTKAYAINNKGMILVQAEHGSYLLIPLTSAGNSIAPKITRQPVDTAVVAGKFTNLSVEVSGTAPFNYRWFKDGTPLPAMYNATCEIRYASASNEGLYTVTVSNAAGQVTSAVARLSLGVEPVIVQQPESQNLNAGDKLKLSVQVTGTAPLSYQWRKDGKDISGATAATLEIGKVSASDAGSYLVLVTNPLEVVQSNLASVQIASASPVIVKQPQEQSVALGAGASFSVQASGIPSPTLQWQSKKLGEPTWTDLTEATSIQGTTGATLTLSSIDGAWDQALFRCRVTNDYGVIYSEPAGLTLLSVPRITLQPLDVAATEGQAVTLSIGAGGGALAYQWYKDGKAIAGANSATLAIGAASQLDAGLYTVVVTNALGQVSSQSASVSVSQFRCTITALSVRAQAGTGEQTMILGVLLGGSGGKPMILRGIGPNLSGLLSDYMRDPKITLQTLSGAKVAENDNWVDSDQLRQSFAHIGMAPLPAGSKDAAIVQTLSESGYVMLVESANGGSGIALAEVYDAAPEEANQRLSAVSVRNQVGVDDNILIAGVIVSGNAPLKVIIRGIGPGMASTVSSYLRDPMLMIHNAITGALVGENDNWEDDPATGPAMTKKGFDPLPSGSKDAAMVVQLQPGAYSVSLLGKDRGTGVGLIEIYEAE